LRGAEQGHQASHEFLSQIGKARRLSQLSRNSRDIGPDPALRRHPLIAVLQDRNAAADFADLVLLILAGNALLHPALCQAGDAVTEAA
jgi:ABC-type hemin transport system ATPase subunit